jgi:hypothetical protein
MNKFNMAIQFNQVEDGFVMTVNAMGQQRQFVSTDFPSAKEKLKTFVDALELPPQK